MDYVFFLTYTAFVAGLAFFAGMGFQRAVLREEARAWHARLRAYVPVVEWVEDVASLDSLEED